MPVGGIELQVMLQHFIASLNFCKILAGDGGEGERRPKPLTKCKMRDQLL